MLRDDFVFHLMVADQTRLQYPQPVVPGDILVATLLIEKLDLRKR
jgi:hypothetical protein